MPPGAARSRMAAEVGSSHCSPKVMVPRQRRETDRPVRPRRTWRMRARAASTVEDLADLVLRDGDLDARALLLEQHGDARVALLPASIEGLGQLVESEVRDAHRHADLAAERRRERDVLVRQPEGEGRGIEGTRQELVGETVEG